MFVNVAPLYLLYVTDEVQTPATQPAQQPPTVSVDAQLLVVTGTIFFQGGVVSELKGLCRRAGQAGSGSRWGYWFIHGRPPLVD